MNHCPYCRSENIKRDGLTIKGFQRFYCHFCRKYWQGKYIRKKSTALEEQKKIIIWLQSHPILSQHLVAVARDQSLVIGFPTEEYHGLCIQIKSEENLVDSKKNITIYSGYSLKIVDGYKEALEQIENYLAASSST